MTAEVARSDINHHRSRLDGVATCAVRAATWLSNPTMIFAWAAFSASNHAFLFATSNP